VGSLSIQIQDQKFEGLLLKQVSFVKKKIQNQNWVGIWGVTKALRENNHLNSNTSFLTRASARSTFLFFYTEILILLLYKF
jgi:hypothetical protein